jgi:hypothetical protein
MLCATDQATIAADANEPEKIEKKTKRGTCCAVTALRLWHRSEGTGVFLTENYE